MTNIPDCYENLAEMANSIVLLISSTGTIQYINKYGSEFFGFERDELVGSNIIGTIVPETDSSGRKLSRFMKDICKDPDRYISNVNENILKSGESVFIAWTNKGLADEDGQIYQLLSVGNDITNEKNLEKELTAARDGLEMRVRERTLELNRVYEELKSLIRRLAVAEEAQKKRISREIHDQIGQNLSTIGLNLNLLESVMSKESIISTKKIIEESLSLLKDTTVKIRNILAELRLPVLDDYGLLVALRWYSSQFIEKTGIKLAIKGKDLSPRPEAHIESALFLIAREALTNVAKHSKATMVEIDVHMKNKILFLSVKDNGTGYKDSGLCRKTGRNGMGLLSMSERSILIGGSCKITSHPGKGTHISVEVPL
jgi:two-component system sensor histidine kinase UhpB